MIFLGRQESAGGVSPGLAAALALFLVGFGVSLLMYVSAVPYPLSEIKDKQPQYAWIVEYNPLTQIIEGFRYMILDTGTFTWFGFFYTLIVSVVLFLIGLLIFNRTEKTFIDTV